MAARSVFLCVLAFVLVTLSRQSTCTLLNADLNEFCHLSLLSCTLYVRSCHTVKGPSSPQTSFTGSANTLSAHLPFFSLFFSPRALVCSNPSYFRLHAGYIQIQVFAGKHSYIMHQLTLASLLAITIFLSTTTAAPTELQRRSFKVHQKRYDSAVSRSGTAAMSKAYRKFGFPLSEAVPVSRLDRSRLANGTGDGEEALQPNSAVPEIPTSEQEADVEFLSPITIGGQSVNLDFDTGSADTWVHPAMEFPASRLI